MDVFEWKGLRTGDAVLVHHGPDLLLSEGEVRFVDRPRRRPMGIGIALTGGEVVWPTPGETHAVPRHDDSDTCWRCALGRERSAGSEQLAALGTTPGATPDPRSEPTEAPA